MTDIDQLLARLNDAPVPTTLSAIDDAVLTGLANRQRDAAIAPRLVGIAAALALGLGFVGGGISGSNPAAAQPLSPFASAHVLAPSTLLEIRP